VSRTEANRRGSGHAAELPTRGVDESFDQTIVPPISAGGTATPTLAESTAATRAASSGNSHAMSPRRHRATTQPVGNWNVPR